MKRALFALIMIVLSGCASVPSGYWERTWEGALTTKVHVVGASPWGPTVKGWTVCDKKARHCDILIVANADYDCVLRHEKHGHAAGLDHPKYRHAFICP